MLAIRTPELRCNGRQSGDWMRGSGNAEGQLLGLGLADVLIASYKETGGLNKEYLGVLLS